MATKFKSSVEIDGYLSLTSGNWVQVPDGTTLQRPGSPAVGMFRYNTTTFEFEGYFGATPAWGAIGGGGGTVTEAFKTFAVSGQSSIVAAGATDTFTVAAGTNVTLTTNAATDTLTINSSASGGVVTIERNNYTANGSTTAFGVSSTIDSENNIQVYLDGVYQDKDTFTTAGTTVTLGTAPINTTEVEIMHFVSVDGIVAVDKFTGNGSTTTFTTSLSITNENATQVYLDGVYQSKDNYGTTGNDITFVTAPPTGTAVEIVHMKVIAASGLNANTFTGDGSQVAFTLSTTVADENLTFVFIQGVYQDKSTYSVSGTTLTFVTAPTNTHVIEVMVITQVSLLGGDITEVIAGTGLTGGGTSGAVTLALTAHTGDVTGTTALTIANDVVTNAKLGVEYTDSSALVSGATIAVDTDTADIFTYTSGVNNTLNFTDVVIGAMKNFVITGGGSSYTVTLGTSNGAACTYNKISGDYDDTASTKNLVQIKWIAVNEAWYTISQPA